MSQRYRERIESSLAPLLFDEGLKGPSLNHIRVGVSSLRPAVLSELRAPPPISAKNVRRSSRVSNLRAGAGKTGLDAVWTSSPEF